MDSTVSGFKVGDVLGHTHQHKHSLKARLHKLNALALTWKPQSLATVHVNTDKDEAHTTILLLEIGHVGKIDLIAIANSRRPDIVVSGVD